MDAGSIFNKNGVPHLSTPNACVPAQNQVARKYSEHASPPQIAKVLINAINTGKYTERLARETEGEIQKRTVEYIRYKLENKSNNDAERNTKSDSDDEPAEDDPRSTSPLYEPAAGELIFITDCYNFPYRDKPPPPTDPAFKTWSPPDPRTTNSLDAFFKHYFCYNHPSSDYWTANRKKTPHPIILCGVTNHNEIHARAKCISGLQTCSAGASPNYVIVMGWDRLTVWRRASEVIAASYSEHPCRYIFDTARNYALAMEGCHDGPLRKKADNWTENAVRGRLDHFQGSYLVRWKEIGGGWDVRAVLKLDIGMGPTKDILGAKLRFLGTEERMLLAHSEEVLDTYLDMFLKKRKRSRSQERQGASRQANREVRHDQRQKRHLHRWPLLLCLGPHDSSA